MSTRISISIAMIPSWLTFGFFGSRVYPRVLNQRQPQHRRQVIGGSPPMRTRPFIITLSVLWATRGVMQLIRRGDEPDRCRRLPQMGDVFLLAWTPLAFPLRDRRRPRVPEPLQTSAMLGKSVVQSEQDSRLSSRPLVHWTVMQIDKGPLSALVGNDTAASSVT
jgi:hypothetical protein